MAQDSQLPALISETSLDVGSFNEWKTDDLIGWLQRTAATLSVAEGWTDECRLTVGAGLHALRGKLGDGPYGRAEKEMANSAGVSERTLQRWRASYEESGQLDPPGLAAKRVAGQKRRRQKEVETRGVTSKPTVIEATAEEIPNAHLSGLEPDESTGKTASPVVAPDAPAVQPSAKDENEAVLGHVRGLLRSDPTVLSRAAKRSVLVELEGLLKRAQQANADDGSRVVLLAPDLVARLAVAPSEPFDAGVNRAIRDLLAPKPAATAKKAATGKTRPAPSRPLATPIDERAVQEAEYGTVNGKCIHPPSRVRNGLCFLCGAENIKAGR